MRHVFQRWIHSFRYAYEGIVYGLHTQRNLRFHFTAMIAVLALCIALRLSGVELLLIMLAVTLVIATELINTAIEKAVDLTMPDIHPLAKIAKDTAAAAVLVTAAFAIGTAIIVLGEPLRSLLIDGKRPVHDMIPLNLIWLSCLLTLAVLLILHGRWARKGRAGMRPSIGTGFLFSISTSVLWIADSLLFPLMLYAAAAVYLGFMIKQCGWRCGFSGMGIGAIVTLAACSLSTAL